jgi:hypothetical protein
VGTEICGILTNQRLAVCSIRDLDMRLIVRQLDADACAMRKKDGVWALRSLNELECDHCRCSSAFLFEIACVESLEIRNRSWQNANRSHVSRQTRRNGNLVRATST